MNHRKHVVIKLPQLLEVNKSEGKKTTPENLSTV